MTERTDNHEGRKPLRPAYEDRPASERVKAIFRGEVRHLPLVDRVHLAEVLRSRVDELIAPTNLDVAIARVQFMTFVRATERASFTAHRDWYAAQADKTGLYSSQTLRTKFGGQDGSWEHVKQLLGAVAREDVTTGRLLKDSKEHREQALLQAITMYARDCDPLPRLERFLVWCDGQLTRHDPVAGGPLPRTGCQINRLFDSWPGLLDSAGLHDAARAARERTATFSASDKECLEFVNRAAGELRDSELSAPMFAHWRTALCASSSVDPRTVPTADAIEQRFGGWPCALHAAGLLTLEQFALRQGGYLRLGAEVAHATLAAALIECGQDASLPRVASWRKQLVAHAARDGDLLLVQTPDTLARIVGARSWSKAKENAAAWHAAGGTPQAGVIRNDLRREA